METTKVINLNLDKIKECYPESIILDVHETFYPNIGWCNSENTVTPYTSMEEVERRIKVMIIKGATHFNFKIQDEFGEIRYPDYSVKELSK